MNNGEDQRNDVLKESLLLNDVSMSNSLNISNFSSVFFKNSYESMKHVN